MGASASPALGQRSVYPDSPPALVSPGASSYSSRSSPSEETGWAHRPPRSLPMSRYDGANLSHMPSEHKLDPTHPRDAPATSAPQLPSLSSLFGPPSSVRVLQSPVSDRPTTYPATSPLDRSHLSSSHSSVQHSYFPPAASPADSQHRTNYDARTPSDRTPFHTVSRSFSGADAVRPHGMRPARSNSQHELDQATTQWAVRAEPPRGSGHIGDKFHFRSPQEPFRLQFPPSKHLDVGHRSAHDSSVLVTSQPYSSEIEGVSVKDGLGPKIWTGTHFLPRFVRSAEVPGEGVCYFYDDGSHCKAVIDGEAVNAHWGVTKAGKPRKRLAIACMTCREKKIKCDPDYPRCVQCEKFGRICKFKNAPRGGHNTSPSTPPAELEDYRESGGSIHPPNGSEPPRSDMGSPTSAKTMLRPTSPEVSKRLKTGDESYIISGDTRSHISEQLDHSKSHPSQRQQGTDSFKIPDDVLSRAWRSNPYASEPHSIGSVVTHFFAQLEETAVLRFVPEEAFKAWMGSSSKKHTSDDLMLLYSVLAVGMTLSGRPQTIASEYAQVALFAQRSSPRPCLQLVQTRMLLALYYKLTSDAWGMTEILSAAVGTASFLHLNAELEASREPTMSEYPLGLTRHGYCEARRRTFWSLFVLDKLDGGVSRRWSLLNAKDIVIRLPSDNWGFEMQAESKMPFFRPSESSSTELINQSLSPAAHLIEVVHLWSKCQAISRRSRETTVSGQKFQHLEQRLQKWQSDLRGPLRFSLANLEAASGNRYLGILSTMHFVVNHARLTLSRCQVSPGDVVPHASHDHAMQILTMVEMLDTAWKGRAEAPAMPPSIWASSLVEAVDILGAEVQHSNLERTIDIIRKAKRVFDHLGDSWIDWRNSRDLVEERIQRLTRIGQGPSLSRSPMERTRQWAVNDAVPTDYPPPAKKPDGLYNNFRDGWAR